MRTFIVVPAFNEAKVLADVLQSLKLVSNDILVVDDGSTDATADIVRSHGIRLYQHCINRGLGGALGTGIAAALHLGADIIVTFDSDGQHDANDIHRLTQPILSDQADVVIGSRLLQNHGMPFRRRVYNRVANVISWMLFGVRTTDSQSGLRAFSRSAAKKIQLRTNKMEVSTEIVREIHRQRLRYAEIPIQPIYSKYSLSKGQNFLVGIKTLIRLIVLRFIK